MPETPTDVIISGGGPNGLLLACELALAGVRPVVLERLPAPSDEQRANGIIGQAPRLLAMRGLFREDTTSDRPDPHAHPDPMPAYMFSGLRVWLGEAENSPIYGMPIQQPAFVRLLAERAAELAIDVRWGHALTDVRAAGDTVTVDVAGPDGEYELTARFLVAADGGRSPVRKRLGIDFPGVTDDRRVSRLGHATVPAEWRTGDGGVEIPGAGRFSFGHNRIEGGMFMFAELTPGKPLIGITEYEREPVADEEPMTFAELRASLERLLGAEVPITPPEGPGPHALRRITGQNTRLAETYRAGNVFLLGDAAHVHSAMGGPGLNLGLQDAFNLGWKLAAEIRGYAPPGLLDTYQSERYPVAERVMMHSLSQTALMAPGPEVTALRRLFDELLQVPQVSAHIAHLLAGSDVRYDIGDDHPLSGRLVPDVTVELDGRAVRIAELFRSARPVLLDFTGTLGDAAAGWADRVDVVTASAAAPPAAALLIRPDGYVAWAATEPGDPGLPEALARWFGTASAAVPASA
ncbi:FAD-dependent monooxygenase [Nocardia blacklockiae]|uniref:FAD-dependent monooxygenase n=1 Tax=Nocardia blacklockiae TaxID=480036 RepID=UPI001893705A|nr:FAD-dependent monooxygenase [Nocardia blacklockiae]MBF6170512.1 FAD-dependent monooxygenase [Nocardia blacklockiae]